MMRHSRLASMSGYREALRDLHSAEENNNGEHFVYNATPQSRVSKERKGRFSVVQQPLWPTSKLAGGERDRTISSSSWHSDVGTS